MSFIKFTFFSKQYRSSTSGFSLVELMIAITIIGLLTSIGLVNLSGSKAKARDAVRVEDLKTLNQAIDLYFMQHGNVFPNNLDDDGMKEYFVDGVIPTDPKTKLEYPYAVDNSSPKHYCLGAAMEVVPGNNVECEDGMSLGHEVTYIIKGP